MSPEEGIGYPLQDSWVSLVAQLVKNAPAMWVQSLGWEDPLEKGTATHSSILYLENSKDCIVHWVMEAAFTFTSLNYPVANCILSKVQIAQTIRCLPELFARNFRSAVSSSSPSQVRLIRNTDPKTGLVQVSDE